MATSKTRTTKSGTTRKTAQPNGRRNRQFTSATPPGGTQRPNVLKGITITLDGEDFECQGHMTLLDLSELSALALSAMDTRSPQGIAMVSQFLQLAFGPNVYLLFKSHVREHNTHDDTIFEILGEITQEVGLFTTEATGRPTSPRGPSSPGPSATDDRTARVISLDQGEVTVVPRDQVPDAPTG